MFNIDTPTMGGGNFVVEYSCEAFIDFCDDMMIAEEGRFSEWRAQRKAKKQAKKLAKENEVISVPKDIYKAYQEVMARINSADKKRETASAKAFNQTVNAIAANIETCDAWYKLFSDDYSDETIEIKAKPIRDLSFASTMNNISGNLTDSFMSAGDARKYENLMAKRNVLDELKVRACRRLLSFASKKR